MGRGNTEDVVRDKQYYYEGADCVIQIENTLFRVHKFLLARDSSAFGDMLTLPEYKGVTMLEGSSDLYPIRLYGESSDRFRILLSILYALPSEIGKFRDSPLGSEGVDTLCAIACITNKYHFTSTETWAINTIYDRLAGTDKVFEPNISWTSARMGRVLEAARLCGHSDLENAIVFLWKKRLTQEEVSPGPALAIADKYGIRSLVGAAYYTQLMQMRPGFVTIEEEKCRTAKVEGDVTTEVIGEGLDEDFVQLSAEQRIRLLSGYWSLTRLWKYELSRRAPNFAKPDGCTYHQHGCLSTWTMGWIDTAVSPAMFDYPPADVIGRLQRMESVLSGDPSLQTALTPQCLRRAMAAVKATIEKVRDSLPDHFVDLSKGKA